jgi:hypothetical protein
MKTGARGLCGSLLQRAGIEARTATIKAAEKEA